VIQSVGRTFDLWPFCSFIIHNAYWDGPSCLSLWTTMHGKPCISLTLQHSTLPTDQVQSSRSLGQHGRSSGSERKKKNICPKLKSPPSLHHSMRNNLLLTYNYVAEAHTIWSRLSILQAIVFKCTKQNKQVSRGNVCPIGFVVHWLAARGG